MEFISDVFRWIGVSICGLLVVGFWCVVAIAAFKIATG